MTRGRHSKDADPRRHQNPDIHWDGWHSVAKLRARGGCRPASCQAVNDRDLQDGLAPCPPHRVAALWACTKHAINREG
jgi:hypothetical protein